MSTNEFLNEYNSAEIRDYKFVAENIKYINENIVKLLLAERKEVLQILYNSIGDSKISTKGNGSQIKYKDIPNHTLLSIYSYIQNKLNIKNNDNCSDSDNE
jgi:hypothetical protein